MGRVGRMGQVGRAWENGVKDERISIMTLLAISTPIYYLLFTISTHVKNGQQGGGAWGVKHIRCKLYKVAGDFNSQLVKIASCKNFLL